MIVGNKFNITSVSSWTDESNLTIKYTLPTLDDNSKVKARIVYYRGTSVEVIADFRTIPSATSNTYSFVLTEIELERLYQYFTDRALCSFRVEVVLTADGMELKRTKTASCRLVNHEPLLNPTVVDANSRTVALTGDNSVFVKEYSACLYNLNAEMRKDATIKRFYVQNGRHMRTDLQEAVLRGVNSNTFYFMVEDSRGVSTRDFIVVDLIPYVKLTAKLDITSQLNANGELGFTISGKYFKGSFGAKSNTMEVEYAVRDSKGNYVFNSNGSGWVILGTVNPTVDSDNNYTFTHTISGLSYTEQYELTVNVIDELTPQQSVATVVRAIPQFDWSADDFRHHTKVICEDNIIMGERKTIRGKTSTGADTQLLGLNASDNLSVGWGGYNTGENDTLVYGANIQLLTKEKVYINNTELDYIAAQGSNGTWYYRKWNSGRVELFGYQNISSLACNTALGGWFRTAVQTAPSFPFTVYNPKVVVSYESDGYGALVWATTTATSSKPYDYYLIRPTSSTGITGRVLFHIDGTWK